MKKVLSLFLTAILLLSFSACGKKEEFNGSPDDIPVVLNEGQQEKFYSADELKQYLTTVEITAENWNEYFEIKEVEAMEKDPLGEEPGYKKIDWYIAFKDESRIAFVLLNLLYFICA